MEDELLLELLGALVEDMQLSEELFPPAVSDPEEDKEEKACSEKQDDAEYLDISSETHTGDIGESEEREIRHSAIRGI